MKKLRFWPLVIMVCLLAAMTALADVRLPSDTVEIAAEAFLNDTSLTGTLTLPAGVKVIGSRAFEGCTGLTGTLVIPQGVTTIGSQAFKGCTGLTGKVRIPDSVTSLAGNAFEGTSLTIVMGDEDENFDPDLPGTDLPGQGGSNPDGDIVITMTDLPEGILYEMTADGAVITGYNGHPEAELKIPARISGIDVVAIADGAFQDCYSLTGSIVIPSTVRRIGSSAFFGCASLDGTLTIPDGVTSIGDFAFYECFSLTGGLTLPDSVESVGESAFGFCEGMTGALSLPPRVTLGKRCFQGSGFTGSITIPATMTLDANVFSGTRLSVTYLAPGFTYEQYGSTVTITGWNGPVDQGLTIPGTLDTCIVTGVAAEAFADVGLCGTVTLPGSVLRIGSSAFRSNPGITALVLPEGLTTIADYAFAECTGLTTVKLPLSCTSVDETAFYGTSVTIE